MNPSGTARLRSCAFVFPGQEAPQRGFGRWLAARSPQTTELLNYASKLTGVNVCSLLRRGGPALERTSVLQPVLVAAMLGVVAELARAHVHPALVAGHSLGEVAAWSASGAITAESAVEVAAMRGRVMEREARLHPGGMLALPDVSIDTVERALAHGRRSGSLDVAARNTVGQWVLTGDEPALRAVAAAFPSTRLAASGPWHSPLMIDGKAELAAALSRVPRQTTHARFVSNFDGRPVLHEDDVPELLAGQLIRPVAWLGTLDYFDEAGVTDVVLVGPTKPHAAIARSRLQATVRVWTTESDDDLASVQKELAG